jgi:small subunit ribosomal protein S16
MVVTPSTTRRDGKFIEVLGTYNPKAHARVEELKLKMDRIDHWLGVGAQPTDTAKSLIRQGRLTPEEWLKKSEREAAKRLARAQKSDVAPEMEAKKEEAPVAEPKAKAEEPKPEEKAVAEVKEDKKEEAPADKPEAKAEESKSKKKPTAEAKEEKKEAKPKAKAEDAKPVKKAPASKAKEEESK